MNDQTGSVRISFAQSKTSMLWLSLRLLHLWSQSAASSSLLNSGLGFDAEMSQRGTLLVYGLKV